MITTDDYRERMTPEQKSFLLVLAGVVMFATGAMIITAYNTGQSTETWGFIGGLLWIGGPPLFLVGLVLWIVNALRRVDE
jgi:hypothetical protein